MPRSLPINRSLPKDLTSLQPHEEGRGTPLPQYEKTQSVPFTLTLQEEKDNPGQFQLVVNVDPQHQKVAAAGGPPKPAASKKLIASLKEAPSLGYDVSQLYQTLKSSPPSSPQEERQGWSDLDAIPPEFLEKVVPDWKVTFSRSDSTASKTLANIKARIKKSGKGFVVRLLKGSNTDNDEEVEVPLGQNSQSSEPALHELDSAHPRVELDGTDANTLIPNDQHGASDMPLGVFEIGSSNEPGIQRDTQINNRGPVRNPAIPHWLSQANPGRFSISEESFSDAETLLADVRSIVDRREEQTDIEPFSRNSSVFPTRSSSVLSIVKTPTRGLSVVGPVRRVEKNSRVRGKGKPARSELNRSGAHKSVKRRSPRTSTSEIAVMGALGSGIPKQSVLPGHSRPGPPDHSESSDEPEADDHKTRQYPNKKLQAPNAKTKRRSSAEELARSEIPKTRLRLQTDLSRPRSANTSPVLRRRRSARTHKSASSQSSVSFANEVRHAEASPLWSEVDPSDELREALDKAFGGVTGDNEPVPNEKSRNIPRIEEPASEADVGDFSLPPEVEIRTAPSSGRSPITTFWVLALSALSEKVYEGMRALRDTYGSEPVVPPNHVRVRWTCVSSRAQILSFILLTTIVLW
jgi:hypothetical protein